MEYGAIEALRERHPAWRLLRAANAALIISSLGRFFVDGNRGATSAAEVAAALDEDLYALNAGAADLDESRFPKTPQAYLDDWSATEIGYLRRFYPPGDDEVHFEVTPSFEKANAWVESFSHARSSAPSPGCTRWSSCCTRSCTARSPTPRPGSSSCGGSEPSSTQR